jgi:hypothetical protein
MPKEQDLDWHPKPFPNKLVFDKYGVGYLVPIEEPVEKLADGYISFRKSKSPFGEKSRQRAIKATEKRAKKREAAKAKARAKSRRVELHGDNEEPEDMSKKLEGFSKSDLMMTIAKGVALGKHTEIKKCDWFLEIQKRSDALARAENLSREVALSRFVQFSPDGQTLWGAYRKADGPDWQGEEEPEDLDTPEVDDPAYVKLCEKARALMEANPQLSFPQAFSICYTTNSSLVDMSKRHHAQKVAKAWMPASASKPQQRYDPGNGSAGNQTTGLDQYNEVMARAEKLNAEGRGKGRSVAQIFSDLWQNNGPAIPGQDDMGTGKDKSTRLQSADKMTAQRLRTTKSFNPNQRPIRLAGAEGWSR